MALFNGPNGWAVARANTVLTWIIVYDPGVELFKAAEVQSAQWVYTKHTMEGFPNEVSMTSRVTDLGFVVPE